MGIHDRDYYRESTRHWFDAWGRWGVVTWLIITSVVVFFLQMVGRDVAPPQAAGLDPLTEHGMYSPAKVREGEVWRLVTPLLLSGGLISLAVNCLTLYWAGSRLEDRYGSREFLLFYLAAGAFAHGACFLAQLAGLVPDSVAIGPRGAILAALVVYACHWPRERILFNLLIPMPVWLLVVLYVAFDIYASSGDGRIPFSVYLAGALFGFAYYRFEWRIDALIPGLPARAARRRAPTLRVVPAEPEEPTDPTALTEPVGAAVESPQQPARSPDEHLEAKVDRVLEKVSKYGQESLTPEEREILFRASEIYKKRRK